MDLLLNTYTDLRYFGSPLALTDEKWKDKTKSLTGAIQINFGETLHEVKEATFHGWGSVPHESGQGGATPTTFYGIPYGLIAFHGIANENAAKTTRLSPTDMDKFKVALWKGVRESVTAHTRTKKEQQQIACTKNGDRIPCRRTIRKMFNRLRNFLIPGKHS